MDIPSDLAYGLATVTLAVVGALSTAVGVLWLEVRRLHREVVRVERNMWEELRALTEKNTRALIHWGDMMHQNSVALKAMADELAEFTGQQADAGVDTTRILAAIREPIIGAHGGHP